MFVMDTGLPAGSPTSGAFRKSVKQLLCRTLLYGDDAEKRNDSGVTTLVSLKIVPEFVALSSSFRRPAFMLKEALPRGTLLRLPMVFFGMSKNRRRQSR